MDHHLIGLARPTTSLEDAHEPSLQLLTNVTTSQQLDVSSFHQTLMKNYQSVDVIGAKRVVDCGNMPPRAKDHEYRGKDHKYQS